MAQRIASLYAEIGAKTDGLRSGLRDARSGLDDLGSAARDVGKMFGALSGGAALAYKAIGQGAELQLARERFDNLASSIGSTSDAIIGDLAAASGGMMSNAEIINSASQIISLGLADNQTDVVKLANLVSRLGLDMQQVILTFANNSKARLDALGLSVEGVTKRAAELEAQGFVGDAFDQAVIEGLTERTELLGDAVDSTAGAMQRLTVHATNAKDAMLEFVAVRSEPALAGAANLLDLLAEDFQIVRDAQRAGIITQEEYRKWLLAVALGGKETRAAIDGLTGATAYANLELSRWQRWQDEARPILLGAARANDELADKIAQAGNQLDFAAVRALKYEQRMGGLAQETGVAADEVFTLGDYIRSLPSETNVFVNFHALGVSTLEQGLRVLNSIRGMTPDAYGGFTPGEGADSPVSTGDEFDPGMGGGPPPGEGGIPTPAPNQGPPSNVAPMNVNITMIGSKATPQQVATEVSRVLTVRG